MARRYRRPRPRFRFNFAWPLLLAGVALLVSGASYVTAAHLEENDGFCASCHTEPETTFFARSQASAVDLASYHHGEGTRCIDCHAGPGFTGRVGAMTLGAGDLLAFVTGRAQQPAPLTVPIGDANCLKCHADVPATPDFDFHFHAFLARWQARDPQAATCVSCHAGHNTAGEAGLMYLERNPTEAVCQACHQVLRR